MGDTEHTWWMLRGDLLIDFGRHLSCIRPKAKWIKLLSLMNLVPKDSLLKVKFELEWIEFDLSPVLY